MASVATLARFVVGLMFVLAGAVKLQRRLSFEQALWRYELIPATLVSLVARWLPVCELFLGVALLVGVGIDYAAILIAVFLGLFGAAIAVNLARGRVFDCGCGLGASGDLIGWPMVLRNTVLAAVAVLVAIAAPSPVYARRAFMGVTSSKVGPGASAALFGAAVITVFVVEVLNEAFRTRGLVRKLSTTSTAPRPLIVNGRH